MSKNIFIRLPNWLGDICMSIPFLSELNKLNLKIFIFSPFWAKNILCSIFKFNFFIISGNLMDDVYSNLKYHSKYKSSLSLVFTNSLSSSILLRFYKIHIHGWEDNIRFFLLKNNFKETPVFLHNVECFYYLGRLTLNSFKKSFTLKKKYLIIRDLNSNNCKFNFIKQINKNIFNRKPLILISPTSIGLHNNKYKVWPYFFQLIRIIQNNNIITVYSIPKNEIIIAKYRIPKAINIKYLKIKEFISFLDFINLIICNDSGVSHMSSIVNSKQITLFGTTCSKRTKPWSLNAIYLGKKNKWPSLSYTMKISMRMIFSFYY